MTHTLRIATTSHEDSYYKLFPYCTYCGDTGGEHRTPDGIPEWWEKHLKEMGYEQALMAKQQPDNPFD